MGRVCPHTVKLGLINICKECAGKEPYMVFRVCSKECLACNECGYFWGPGHILNGQRPYWITK